MSPLMKFTLLASVATALIGSSAVAKERLNFAYGFPVNSNVGKAVEAYKTAVEERSGGEIVVTGFPMTLLSTSESSAGVRDGLADVAFVLPPYHAAEYPTNLFLHELNPMLNLMKHPKGKEPLAYGGAMLEYTLTKCPECLDEYKAQNQVYTASGVTPLYGMLCKDTKVSNLDEIKGKRLRAGGAGFVRFAENFDAKAIRIPTSEAYEALDQGIIDCAMISIPELTNYNLYEVVTDITPGVPGGVFAGNSSANVNRDRWLAMDDATREAMLWGGATMSASATWLSYLDDADATAKARELGINFHEPAPEMVAAVQEYVKQDLANVAKLFKENYNVARADEITADFTPLLEKWYGLVDEVESFEDLRQVYWDEVLSKVDPATYAQ